MVVDVEQNPVCETTRRDVKTKMVDSKLLNSQELHPKVRLERLKLAVAIALCTKST